MITSIALMKNNYMQNEKGPPGIGKTTTAELTCKEAGYTFIALNASDSRSKKLLVN
jgi:replication-associated recombination protein RarA